MAYEYGTWWSPNRNPGGNARAGITVHHAAETSFDGIGRTFQDSGRQTSAHYGVAPGRVCQYVDEGDIAWHTGNAEGNRTQIGIECVNSTGEAGGWQVSEATVDTLVELVADIARRNGLYPLRAWGNLWGHRDWSSTYCPGALYSRLPEIAERANSIIEGEEEDDMTPEQEKMLREVHTQLTRTDTAGHDNPAGHDMFGMLQIIRYQLTRTDAEGHKANKGHDFLGTLGLVYAKLCEVAETVKDKKGA